MLLSNTVLQPLVYILEHPASHCTMRFCTVIELQLLFVLHMFALSC